jgi:predicted anti-sigma-YlaC factor YlaD
VSINNPICETEKIAAFIDGELEPSEYAALEEHISHCSSCTSELQAQRVFMCELNSALAGAAELAVPADFARVVAVHAESDMRGVRDRSEHTRALQFCIILGLAAFALLGVTSSKAVILSAQTMANKTVGILGLLGKAVYNAAAGFTVISRVLSGGLIADSRLVGLIALVVVALAVGLLSLLIARYHRTRLNK